MELGRLLSVWIALLVLLALTIGASFLPIGDWRQAINLAIAAAKAALILWVFMAFRTETPLVRLVMLCAAVLLFVLATLLAADYFLRPEGFL